MKWHDLSGQYASRIAEMKRMRPAELLGVGEEASREDIRAAYIRLAKTYHPDHSDPFMARHNQEVLKLINAAYEKLLAGR